MRVYIGAAAAFAVLTFVIGSIDWSRGLGWRARLREIVITAVVASAFGVAWPVLLVGVVLLRIWG